MRRPGFPAIVFIIAALAVAATASAADSGWYNYQKNTKDALHWHEWNHDASHELTLSSGDNAGIHVTQASPVSVWGLHQGDTIIAIDDVQVEHVDDMLQLLLAKKPATVTMHLRDKNGERSIQVASKDYEKIVLPTPPAPPAPPQ